MLFVVSDRDFFEDNPHARIMKEFAGASSATMKFVALYSDWRSPYRKLDNYERRERALMAAGFAPKGGLFTKEGEAILNGRASKVEDYIEKYKGLQGIESEEASLSAIKSGEGVIRDRLNNLDETTSAKDIGDLAKSLTMLAKERRVLEDLIDEKLGVEFSGGMSADEDAEEESAWERSNKRNG
jgi:hypothetical protein